MFLVATLIVVVGLLSLVHIFVGKLRFLERSPDIWKSVAAGVGITYAFLVLLPKIARAQPALQAAVGSGLLGFLQHHSYLVALTGLVFYYGMDVAVENLLVLPHRRATRMAVKTLVLLHAGSLSGYYFLVSYLMSESHGRGYVEYVALSLFAAAMLLHYLTIDHGLRHKYGGLYDLNLRWAFVIASSGGWMVAAVTEIPYSGLALLNSLFAGALIIFTLKEKLPGSMHVRFWPFLLGVAGYSLLLLVIELLAS